MNLDEALHTFVVEARELLQNMEESLLDIERGMADDDAINAIFRAAHTIKGSAGLFGLDFVVEFTHIAENVLDKVRAGELKMDGAMTALMLQVCDHLNLLVECVARAALPEEAAASSGKTLTERLAQYLGSHQAAAMPVESEAQLESLGGGVESDCWHISLRFGKDVLRYGMDPLSFIRYLGKMGRIVSIHTLADGVPCLAEIDPESCYLGFEISFESDADKAAIEGVFEFVRDDCHIGILPPHSKIAEYMSLIRELPEDEMRLGDILVKCGTLTAGELEEALKIQNESELRPIGEVLVEQSMVQAPVVEAALEKQKQVKESKNHENSLIRVDSAKLDQLINLVGELIIVGSSASLIAQKAGMGELLEVTSTMSRMVEEVRDTALSLRMVQIGATFNRFQRVVRDVSHELGKDIRLVISGAETELDKTVVEKIGDPLTHLVRNSMDHGIESAEIREARGKPVQGTLKLNAYHDSGSIVIEVTDDGGGLNRDKILKKAIEKGLVAPDAELSDKEIYQLIFEAGFSTADAVSNLSGRGVGMDVVRRNIQDLRGTIELESSEGMGTTTRIRLPLTLSIIDGFLVGVGASSYVIPLDMVVECIELDAAERESGDNGYLNLRGEVLPFVRLRDLFEVEGMPSVRQNVVVVQYAGHRAGFVVDTLEGELQTVIKPLGRVFGGVRGIGGFTILGSGEVALILDVQRLVQQATERELGHTLSEISSER
ncbi:MAG: chemotaxis protein CheA, partial [Burkholderiales bacterium]